MDCEIVSDSRLDHCPVCGSHSLLSLAKIIGGTHLSPEAPSFRTNQEMRFDVEITIGWKKLLTRELNGAIESIDRLIGPWLISGQASCHIDVAPLPEIHKGDESKAAA